MPEEPGSIVRRSTPPPSRSTPVVTPLQPSVVYASEDADDLDDLYDGRAPGFTYAREGHPNAVALAGTLDWMEGAPSGSGVVTSSGMAAIGSVLLGLLEAGDHVVGGDQLYGRTHRLVGTELPRLGFATSFADPTDTAAVEEAIGPETRMLIVETVSNPTLRVADIDALAEIARRHAVMFVVDNTFTTPRMLRPFEHGADVVVHSVTKLLAGHSDVTLGYAAARDPEHARVIREAGVTWGLTPSPFDCWLAERGLHTFELRYDRAASTAALLADRVAEVPGVQSVIYPGRDDHPDREVAARLLGDRGGTIVGLRLAGDRARVNRFLRAAKPLSFAPTLGDVATLLSHPPSSSHRALTASERESLGITEGFIRISVGLEDPDYLATHLTTAIKESNRDS